ncbi:MAG: DUF1653 domain-containing protein [Lachnospiraceae bacterium]|nr:DUF1653 domain-containing protein [Lachnospiraceae bacterium]
MERNVYPGEIYRHFKGKQYQIIAVARHSETGERMVVYQALYGDFAVYVRPFDMFVSQVDREKYPDAPQSHRFQKMGMAGDSQIAERTKEEGADSQTTEGAKEEEKESQTTEKTEIQADAHQHGPNQALLGFLDAEGFVEQIACLKELAKTASQSDLDSIYVVLDMKPQPGTIEEQIDAVGSYLTMQQHFEGGRLR